jgi:Flp pilus assembly protein TadG
MLEAALAMILGCGLMYLVIDTGWSVFVKATLQHAVAEGVRYAVTGQTSAGQGQIASIESVVQTQAMGLLSSQMGTLSVQFYNPTTLAPTTSNLGGNLVEVSIQNYQLAPLAPLLYSSSAIPLTVRATDILEPSPGGVPPAP